MMHARLLNRARNPSPLPMDSEHASHASADGMFLPYVVSSDSSASSSESQHHHHHHHHDDHEEKAAEESLLKAFLLHPYVVLTSRTSAFARHAPSFFKRHYAVLVPASLILAFLLYCVFMIIFDSNWFGIGLFFMRQKVPLLHAPYDNLPTTNEVCVMQALDQKEKDVYQRFLDRNQEWAHYRGWRYFQYIKEEHTGEFPDDQMPHFLKYHGMKRLFDYEDCRYIIYIDSDSVAVRQYQDAPIPFSKKHDFMFGNELTKAVRYALGHSWTISSFNSGFMLVQRTDFSRAYIEDILHHPRCEVCRTGRCTIFKWFDQGCMEKLFEDEYKDRKDHFAVGQVQWRDAESNFMFCHLAGHSKRWYPKLCDVGL